MRRYDTASPFAVSCEGISSLSASRPSRKCRPEAPVRSCQAREPRRVVAKRRGLTAPKGARQSLRVMAERVGSRFPSAAAEPTVVGFGL